MASKQHLFLIVVETGSPRSRETEWEPVRAWQSFYCVLTWQNWWGALWGLLYKGTNPIHEGPTPLSYHLWTPIPSVIITLGTQFQHMKLGRQFRSIAPSLNHCHTSLPPTLHHTPLNLLIKTLYRYSFRNMFWVPLFARHCVRVGHNWAISLSLFTFMRWRRKWQPTPEFLPGESQGRGSLVGCHLWGCTESDTTEAT